MSGPSEHSREFGEWSFGTLARVWVILQNTSARLKIDLNALIIPITPQIIQAIIGIIHCQYE